MINDIIYSPDYLVNSGGVIAIASEINKKEKLLEKKLIEIGSNDGTYLYNFKNDNLNTLGFEPSSNVSDLALKKGINTINSFL